MNWDGAERMVRVAAGPATLEGTLSVPEEARRPDLAGPALPNVLAPTLLVVGGNDFQVLAFNHAALAQLKCEKRLVIVPGATHLFEEPGVLDEVARLAREWFDRYLASADTGVAERRA